MKEVIRQNQKPLEAGESPVDTARLKKLLFEHFAFKEFRKGQLDILSSVLSKRDTLAVMPTGGGKSLCYQLPALYLKGIVLVISPLIALMKDQVRLLKELGIPAGAIHSGQDMTDKRDVFAELKNSESFILFVSPERVQNQNFFVWLKANEQKIKLIAIDEAHCVSQWGHDFREDYHKLSQMRKLVPSVAVLALTATATPPVLKDIEKSLELRKAARHIHGFYRPNLYYQVEDCKNEEEKLGWIKQAVSQFPVGRVLIYCGTRKQSKLVADALKDEFKGVKYYHAGLTAESRDKIQKKYNKGECRILAATNAFGMGIDHPNVRLVIHFQIPANIESLYQEMGRAGRDREHSTCLILYAKKDKGLHAYFITKSQAQKSVINSRWRALETLQNFAETYECRHAGILTYFRDPMRMKKCGHCDACDQETDRKIQKPVLAVKSQSKKRKTRSRKKAASSMAVLSEQQQAVYKHLKDWRKQFASDNDVPAFVVLSNKSLEDLCRKMPSDLTELEDVYGFGPQKIEKFGAEVLSELQLA